MSRSPHGELFAAKLRLGPGSAPPPPPGTYLSIGLDCGGRGIARAFLTEAQALALGEWLCRSRARRPEDRVQEPTAVRVAATEWAPAADDGRQPVGRPRRRRKRRPPGSGGQAPAAGAFTASGDRLVTTRFVAGVRERWAGRPTEALERELATFEPDLARMAGRLMRGVVAGHLGVDAAKGNALADACRREALVLLVALRGAWQDLWHDVLTGEGGEDGEAGGDDDVGEG